MNTQDTSDSLCTCVKDPQITCIVHPTTGPQAVEARLLATEATLREDNTRQRWENVAAVEIEVDANGFPTIYIFPNEGKPYIVHTKLQGVTRYIEDRSNDNKLW